MKVTDKKKLCLISSLVMVIIFMFILIINRIFLFSYIPSESMEPTINSPAFLIGLKSAYKQNDPKRGDIIFFKYPFDESVYYIKRIIGLPGERIEIRDGEIFIDNSIVPLQEDYLQYEWKKDNDGFVFEIPDNCYLVLGDNRNSSVDSRYWKEISLDLQVAKSEKEANTYTYISRDDIIAKAIYQVYPYIKKWSE